MKKIVKKPFDWAHRGVEIEHFEAGREIDLDDEATDAEMVEVAEREGWFEDDEGDGGSQKKASQRAPQRQAAANAPETK